MTVRARSSDGAAATTSHTVTMPGGVVAGDRIVVGFVNDDAATTASTSSTGWTSPGSQAQGTGTNHRLTIFQKVATGSDTLTVAVSTSQEAEWVIIVMNGDGGAATVQFANGASATTATVTAQTGLTLGDYTSIVFLGLDNSVATAHTVTPPAGFADLTTAGASGDVIFAASMDDDFTAVTSISPASVTFTNAEQWVTGHVAVPAGPTYIAPGTVFDLDNWKWTLPTDGADGGTAADEITQPTLETYADEHFYLDGSNRLVATAPVQGDTTSGSGGTRSEGREMEGGVEADWPIATTAPRQLTVTAIWDPTSITDREEMLIEQIHGETGTPPVYVTVDHTTTPTRMRVFKNGPGFGNLLTGLTSTTKATLRIYVGGGRVKLYAAVGEDTDLPTTPQFDWPASDFTDRDHCYFKAGAYNKSTVADGGTGAAIATISRLELLQNMTSGNVRTRGAAGAAATTAHSVAMPAGVQVGDRLVVGFVNDTASVTASTTSTGWTSLGSQAQGSGSNHRMTVFTKIATGSDTLVVNLSSSAAARWSTIDMVGDGGTPSVQFGNGGSATSGAVTAHTGLAVGDYTSVIFLGLDNSVGLAHAVTAPSGWANTTTTGGGSDPVVAASMDQDVSAVTSISPSAVTWTNAEQWITAHVVVPAPAATTTTRIPTRRRSRRLAALLDL